MPESRPTEGLDTRGHDHQLVRQFRLRVLVGPDDQATYESTGDRCVIGTHKSANFLLHDPTLSRFHCEIVLQEGQPLLRDLGSRNGTRVDGVAVQVAYLHDQAILTLGRTRMRLEIGAGSVKVPLSHHERFGMLVGRSSSMRAVFALLEHAAQSSSTLLLQGETGTGKDLAAESIHLESARREGPFIIVDCGAIAPTLLESHLFGHERGAFTGADRAHEGAFEAAHGGTLFLDEIGELGLELQPKLLRALESRKVKRVGGTKVIPVDVRLIAATNRNLREEVNARRFRSDLYYRLAVLEATLPPLRDRLEDLPLLVSALLEGLGIEAPQAHPLAREEFVAALTEHRWPGNIRELRNYMERCLALDESVPLVGADADSEGPLIDVTQPLRKARERFERRYLEALLAHQGSNVSATARAANIDRVHLYRLLSRYGLR